MRPIVTASLAMATALTALGGVATAGEPLSGRQLFVRHCARCHTTAGIGLPESHPLLESFEAPPADFSDPLFNSMEPAADWALVVKHGGGAMGLSDQMPAHGERLTDQQIDAPPNGHKNGSITIWLKPTWSFQACTITPEYGIIKGG